MATIGRNISFPIYNGDGTSFHDLVMKRATYDSIVMSLGDKITGDVYYKDNTLVTNQDIYIVYNGVHYTLVNPPTIVREGMTSENGELKGMTKYSFEFYHPMYQLNNFPFSDIAVTSSQGKYLSQNKTFAWIGDLYDYVDKINVNLEETVWCCEIGSSVQEVDKAKLSDVLSFNNQTIADALKTGYETWEIPYVISQLPSTDTRYSRDGKRFLITFGLPSTEIIGANNQPYVFRFGQGVGLKNNSRTPRNNKIVTRLAGYGSENNIPWGYPQIIWTGDESWNYTIDNDPTDPNSYPIYDGIVNGERVRLIKHPFTRNHLMPSIYAETVNRKVNPNAIGYDPDTVIIDYYDADDEDEFENIINLDAPSYEIHEFEDIKPELGEQYLVDVSAYDANAITISECESMVLDYYSESNIEAEKTQLLALYNALPNTASGSGSSGVYKYDWSIANDGDYLLVKYKSSGVNFEHKVTRQVTPDWDDSIDDDGNYKQSYFKVTLPELGFDLYACAALTEKMQINMRSGDCIGCTFDVMIDWDDYKKNFYTEDGKFDPVIGTGHPRNGTKYPDSTNDEITLIVQKDNNTFGIIMPNIYQQPTSRDKFVILGISLPLAYITDAEERLDADMIQYMKDNNVFYFDYPLKFDEDFLYRNTSILAQMKPNVIVRFEYAGVVNALYIKQMSIKYGQGVLPQYDITLTDDVEIVLNKIGQVTDEVSKLRLMMGEGGDANVAELDKRYLSKRNDDTAEGMISMTKGLYVGNNFVTGLLGEGGVMRMDNDGTTYLEVDKMYVRMRAYFDTVEVRRFLHSGGNRIASLAGMKCTRVEYINSSGNVTKDASSAVKFRCYFRANDDGNVVTNDFVVGDLAFCKETNAKVGTGVEQHGYWRAVVGVSEQPNSKGEHWIDLSKSDCLSGSDIPIAQDDIIQLGNKTDTTRQGAIIEYVGGDDAPAYQIYQGINTYSLNDKNYVRFGYDSQSGGAQAYIGNPDGSTYLWYHNVTEGGVPIQRLDIKANVKFTSPTTQEETNIQDFAQSVVNEMADLQSQIDGEIDNWFYAGTPTLNNLPASEWDSDDEKDRHLGDLYYDIGTGQTAGFAYRFIKNLNDEYEWQYLEDTAITEALAAAARAQDTADHKRRVFISQPTPPYDIGDLWVNATYGTTYSNDVLRCKTARASGTNFSINHWQLASKYTDDSALEAFKVDVSNDYGYLTQALNNETEITGGLLLTSLIGLRDGNQNIQSGINAILKQSLGTKSIAAWFGGAMSDKENPTYYTDNRYAKSLFRFDGSGYVADGNLSWDESGNVTIQGYSIDATTLKVGGKGVATAEALANYLPLAGGTMKGDIKVDNDNSRTLGAAAKRWKNIYSISAVVKNASTNNDGSFIEIGQIRLVYDHNNNALKVVKNDGTSNANFYATGTVSALGANTSGGGGTGIEMDEVWAALAQAGNNEPINYTHIQSALTNNGYMHSFSKTNPTGANVVTDVSYNSGTGTLSVTRGSLAMNALAPKDTPTTLATFYDGDNLIYTRAGGNNSVADKPSVVDAFGVITMRTASGYYGQILYGANGHIYYRSAARTSLEGTAWNTLLGTLNYKSYTYDKTATYNKNLVLASSATADGNAATFRALADADIPNLNASKITAGTLAIARGGTGSATTSPHYVFIGASSGTAASAPSFRALVAADLPDLSGSYLRKKDVTAGAATNVDANELSQANTLYVPTGDMGGTSASGTWSNFPTTRPSGGFSLMNIAEGAYCRQIFGTYSSNKLYVRTQHYVSGSKPWYDWSELLLDNIAQTVSSKKTFSVQQAFTVANGTSPFTVTSGTLVTNLNADKVDGYHASSFSKRIALNGSTNHRRFVVAFCELSDTSSYVDSFANGRITFHRSTGINPDLYADVAICPKYSASYGMYCTITTNYRNSRTTKPASSDTSQSVGIRPCTFTYTRGDTTKVYGGIEFYLSASQSETVAFYGETNFDIFRVDYYDTNNKVAINSEIYNSIDFATGIDEAQNYLYTKYFRALGNAAILDTGATNYNGSYLQIGYIRLVYDHANNAIKVVKNDGTSPANFYATGSVSALGANNNSSGGGGADIDDVWAALATSDSSKLIDSSHINISVSGSGNAVTGITPSGTSITLNKGTSFLPLTGNTTSTPISNNVYFTNDKNLIWKAASGNVTYNVLRVSSNNNLVFGEGIADAGRSTYIYGSSIYLRYSSSKTIGLTLGATGDVSIAKNLSVDGVDGITALKFVKSNGTATQFLKADGSVDESTYLTADDGIVGTEATSNVNRRVWFSYGTTTENEKKRGYNTNFMYNPSTNTITANAATATEALRLPYSYVYGGGKGGGWWRAATCSTTSSGTFTSGATFYVSSQYHKGCGILEVLFRKESNATTYNTTYTRLRWVCRDSTINPEHFKLVVTVNSSTNMVCDLYFYQNTGYGHKRFYKLDDAGFSVYQNYWTMTSVTAVGGTLPAESTTTPIVKHISCADESYASDAGKLNGVAASGYVTIAGAQTITGVKTFDVNTLIVNGGEVESDVNKSTIRISTMGNNSYKNAAGTAAYAQLSGIRNCIRFDWYDTAWAIGNVRGGGYDSQGFAIGYMNSGKDGVLHRFLIRPNGNILTNASITAGSEVTASSDARSKDVIEDTKLKVKDIALAPSIRYTWKDKRDEKVHIGSIAQYWEKALPEAVSYDGNGIMSLNYGALALVSAITIARGLMKHEDEITKLKKRVAELENELKERRAA